MQKQRILVIGAAGMLGHTVLRMFLEDARFETQGVARRRPKNFPVDRAISAAVQFNVNVEVQTELLGALVAFKPDVIINYVGVIKQLPGASSPLTVLPLNTLFPHLLNEMCGLSGARLIHVSTDCVFSGKKGNYIETDSPDASDLYGRSKLLGEVLGPRAITLRTSIIGHEIEGRHGLLEWFLGEEGKVLGYSRAIFSGLPCNELAKVMRDIVLPRPDMTGVFHVAAAPISKFNLLRLISAEYSRTNTIESVEEPAIDRSLDASRFQAATGYIAPSWPQLIHRMKVFG